MPEVLTRFTIQLGDRDKAKKAADVLNGSAMLKQGGLFVIKDNDETITAEVPASVLYAMKSVLTALAETGEVLLLRSEGEISAEKAAEILRISRPLVYQRMDSGKLPFRLVGRHRRIRVSDVLVLKKLEDNRRGLEEALAGDAREDLIGVAKTAHSAGHSSAHAPKLHDIDQLVLGTTNAPYRRTMNATDLVTCISSTDWQNWIAHVVTFFTEVRPELVLEFARRHAIPVQDLATAYRSIKSATGEANPALESEFERMA